MRLITFDGRLGPLRLDLLALGFANDYLIEGHAGLDKQIGMAPDPEED
jgi:hypothetical protein